MPEQLSHNPEVENIPFNSGNETGFETEVVVIDGEKQEIHHTNNLKMKFGSYIDYKEGKDPATVFDEVYRDSFPQWRFEEIFDELAANYPVLYQKMLEITTERFEERETLGTGEVKPIAEEEIMERKVVFSKAFDALVPIARHIDPNYDLGNFCR